MIRSCILTLPLCLFSINNSAESPATAPQLTQRSLAVKVTLEPTQALLHDSVSFSTNAPFLQVVQWQANKQPESVLDQSFKENKLAYQGTVIFTLTLEHNHEISAPTGPSDKYYLYMHYLTTNSNTPQERRFIIPYQQQAPQTHQPESQEEIPFAQQLSEDSIPTPQVPLHQSLGSLLYTFFHWILSLVTSGTMQAKQFISHLLTNTHSLGLQIILALFLGILMSLTPCIYPMIPITVGILGTHDGNSLLRNFSLALSYTCGLATTFALLGLFTSLCGVQCGQILSNPIFIIILVAILAYLGCSMFGWYEMRIPRFLQPKATTVHKGSYLSAFLFGMGSGTIASPCMSPGLALVLTIAASLKNVMLGFLLLFIFGLGASMPLLLVGTFSASLHILPQAGMWMMEIKKIFGFMLLGMCFFYLKNILPLMIIYLSLAVFLAIVGWYYLHRFMTAHSLTGKILSFLVSLGLLTTCFYTLWQGYSTVLTIQQTQSPWRIDYEQARAEAIKQNKKLLLDFGATWCGSCQVLEHKILTAPEFITILDQIIAVKIDGSHAGAEPFNSLIQQYNVIGMPTLLLIDPKNDSIIQRWGSEWLDLTPQQCVEKIQELL